MVPLRVLFLNLTFDFSNFTKQIPLLLVMTFLIMCSAFFSASETAYSSINIIRLRNFVDDKRKGAKKALYIAEKYDIMLTSILVGNNLVNIGATTIGAYIFTQTVLNPTLSNILNTVVMTLIILTFGEIIPKSYSKEYAEKIALRWSGILFFVIKLLYPISWVFLKMKKVFIGDKSKIMPMVTEDELESIIDIMNTEGVIESDSADLLQRALDLSSKKVYDIMTPRVDVVAINIVDSIENIKQIFFENKYTRVPVYQYDKDNIIGILNERDFLTAYIKSNNAKFNIKSLMTKPYFVSETTMVDDLIKEMQKMNKHFAIVVDEYGGTSGIVTMEDALEELVGEIYDESDEYVETDDPEYIVKLADNKYLISAEMELDYLFETLKLGKEPKTKYSTVGGFIYELSGELPYKDMQVGYVSIYEKEDLENPIFKQYQLTFIIDQMENKRIKTIEINIDEIQNKAA